nr:Phosphomannomutase/phosphoglucomutase [Citrobacter werkmanii]
MQRLAEANDFPAVDESRRGRYQRINPRDAYIDHLLGYINPGNLKPMKLVLNAGNGAAGPVVDAIEARFKALGVPVEFIKIHNTPDGNFPNGIPNPLLPECRADTRNAVISHGADMGIAFDGDFDRCFLFDEKRPVYRRVLHLSVCWRKRFWRRIRGRKLSTTRACPGTPWMW